MNCPRHLFLSSLLLIPLVWPAQGQPGQIVLSNVVFNAGALNAESTSFRLVGTLGQPFVGTHESAKFRLDLGFWGTVDAAAAPTAIETIASEAVPVQFLLDQNYPNPFNPATRIRYALPEPSSARLAIYDVLGRTVTVLVNRQQAAGIYEVTFEAGYLPSGMYFYHLETDRFSEIRQMSLIK